MFFDNSFIKLAAEFIRESNLIESIDVPFGEVVDQLRSRSVVGHVGALLRLDAVAMNQEFVQTINKQEICAAQSLIMREQNSLGTVRFVCEAGIGHYRGPGVNVVIAGRMGMRPERIETAMNALLRAVWEFLRKEKNKAARCSKEHTQYIVKKIARFHYRFEQIHPFVDGNGRSGRLLVWYLFRFLGLAPFVFTDHDKRYTYYQCFDEVKDMEKYFLRRYKL